MGINIGLSDHDLDDSFGDGTTNTGGAFDDDFDIDQLESEDEDLHLQDEFKGINLSAVAKMQNSEMSRAERRVWYDDDGNANKYKIAMQQRPKHLHVKRVYNKARIKTRALKEQYSTKNDI